MSNGVYQVTTSAWLLRVETRQMFFHCDSGRISGNKRHNWKQDFQLKISWTAFRSMQLSPRSSRPRELFFQGYIYIKLMKQVFLAFDLSIYKELWWSTPPTLSVWHNTHDSLITCSFLWPSIVVAKLANFFSTQSALVLLNNETKMIVKLSMSEVSLQLEYFDYFQF